MVKYLIIITLIALAWCPWLTSNDALSAVNTQMIQLQQSNPNLCPMTADVNSITKVPFGYTEQVSYNCAAKDPVMGISKSVEIVFITFYKGVFNMPNQTVANSF
jgi:hypothetical protein